MEMKEASATRQSAPPRVEADDSELVRCCLNGQREAFDTLMAHHYRRVYNLTYRMLGNREDASDLTQEAFLRAYTRLGTFDQNRPFLAWLRAIAVNLCISHLRRRPTRQASLDQQLDCLPPPLAAEASSPERRLEMTETSRRVLAAVQQLPDKQRAVMVLRHVEGLDLQEIARTLRLPLGTVKASLFRARRAVREMVGEL
jgi:RNA polymerase sigma-70 factor (ECF subfamily)